MTQDHLEHSQAEKLAGGHIGHDMTAMFKNNQKALKISAALTGFYFSTLQVEQHCDQLAQASDIDFASAKIN